jgi:hypothetical protein
MVVWGTTAPLGRFSAGAFNLGEPLVNRRCTGAACAWAGCALDLGSDRPEGGLARRHVDVDADAGVRRPAIDGFQRDGLRALGEQSLPAAENHRNRDESVFVDEVVLDQRP